jgi:hypothetical protein
VLDLAEVRDSWDHRRALAALVGIDVTAGISDRALRRALRKAGGARAIEREIEDARYGVFPPAVDRPPPASIVRRGRRPG